MPRYGLMLALFAASLFTWSEAARGHRRELYLPLLANCARRQHVEPLFRGPDESCRSLPGNWCD